MDEMSQCKNCLMELPSEHINEDECIFCVSHRKKWGDRDYEAKEKELIEILDFYKEKHKNDKYDCIVPLSGGKDSTYVLYLTVKKYGMRPLTVTFNNGLQTQLARNNIENAVTELGVDHITVAPNKKELQAMYREFFLKTGNMCTVCNHIINTTIIQTAAKENISFVLVGGVSKLELAPIYGNKRYCMEDVFKRVLCGINEFDINKYCNKPIREKNKIEFVTLFNYVDYDYNEVLRILKSELGWSESNHGDTKIDCEFHPVISYFKYLKNNVSSAILMSSALLRDKKISKEEYDRRITDIKKHFDNIDTDDTEPFFEYLNVDESVLQSRNHVLDYVEPLVSKDDLSGIEELKSNPGYSKIILIEKLIEIILPEIKRDGGNLKIIEFNNNELKVDLSGACRGCLQADDTMIPHIETLIKTYISDDISVERHIRLE
ncbi:NifU family protein [Bacteroidota bacterium]